MGNCSYYNSRYVSSCRVTILGTAENIAVIVGMSVAVILILVAVYCYCKKKHQQELQHAQQLSISHPQPQPQHQINSQQQLSPHQIIPQQQQAINQHPVILQQVHQLIPQQQHPLISRQQQSLILQEQRPHIFQDQQPISQQGLIPQEQIFSQQNQGSIHHREQSNLNQPETVIRQGKVPINNQPVYLSSGLTQINLPNVEERRLGQIPQHPQIVQSLPQISPQVSQQRPTLQYEQTFQQGPSVEYEQSSKPTLMTQDQVNPQVSQPEYASQPKRKRKILNLFKHSFPLAQNQHQKLYQQHKQYYSKLPVQMYPLPIPGYKYVPINQNNSS